MSKLMNFATVLICGLSYKCNLLIINIIKNDKSYHLYFINHVVRLRKARISPVNPIVNPFCEL
jgi:hypothetical protein